VLWIRIRRDPKLYAGSGSVTRRGCGVGSGSETGLEPYQKSAHRLSLERPFLERLCLERPCLEPTMPRMDQA
jgi:hypothetical protein